MISLLQPEFILNSFKWQTTSKFKHKFRSFKNCLTKGQRKNSVGIKNSRSAERQETHLFFIVWPYDQLGKNFTLSLFTEKEWSQVVCC